MLSPPAAVSVQRQKWIQVLDDSFGPPRPPDRFRRTQSVTMPSFRSWHRNWPHVSTNEGRTREHRQAAKRGVRRLRGGEGVAARCFRGVTIVASSPGRTSQTYRRRHLMPLPIDRFRTHGHHTPHRRPRRPLHSYSTIRQFPRSGSVRPHRTDSSPETAAAR